MPSHFARHVVLGVKELAVFNGFKGSVSKQVLRDGGFCSKVDDTARESRE